MIPTVIGITLVTFFVMALAPGGIGAMMDAEGNMRPAEREAMRKYIERRYGYNKPLHIQYLRWLNNALPLGIRVDEDGKFTSFGFKKPDLGESSQTRRKVLSVILERLPVTVALNLIAIPIIYAVSITAGIRAAQARGRTFDVASSVVFVGLWSLPGMWVGVLLIGFMANREYMQWFPTSGLHDVLSPTFYFMPHNGPQGWERGYLIDLLWHMVLPLICMTYGGFAVLSRMMRASMLENISADFARTARAKGLSENVVVYRHVLRNSVLPLITLAASILPGMLGGSIVVEKIFSIEGMGKLMFEAIQGRDRELVMSETLVITIISLVSLLVADILYAVVDPRVSYE